MKKRDRFRKFLSSIFKTHTDPKKELLANKKDIEKRLEKIIKLISKESDASANSFEKSELASLISDFYHGYQTLYEYYDHLIGKLGMKVHYKRESNEGTPFAIGSPDSESSDLGSEDWQINEIQTEDSTMFAKLSDFERLSADLAERQLAIEKLENNLQTMDESIKILQAENGYLKQKLGIFSQEQADMNQRIRNFNEQHENLISEKTKAFSRLHDAEKPKGKRTLDEISKPSSDNGELEKEMEERAQLVDDLNQKLSNTDKQNEALRSAIFVQAAEKAWADHRDEGDQNLKLNTDRLSTENERLSVNENFKLKLEHSQRNGDELNQRSAASEEEKRALESENLRSSYQMQAAENTIQNQKLTIDRLSSENVQLSENENLKPKPQHSRSNRNVLSQKLAAINKEKKALESEILRSYSQIHEAEETIKNLTMDSELLKEEEAKLLNIVDDEQLYTLQLEPKEDVVKTQETQDKKEMLPVKIKKMKNINSQLLLNCRDLKQKLEARNQEASELKLRLETTNDEKHSLTRENLALSSKIGHVKINFNDLKAQVEQLENDKSQLLIKLNDMDLELEGVKLQLSGLNNELGAAANKIRTLVLESSRAMSEFKRLDACNKVLEHELKQLKEENLILQECKSKLEMAEEIIENLKAEAEQLRSGKSQLQSEIGDLNLKLEIMILQLTGMNREIGVAKEEKNASTLELEQVGANGKNLETELQQLKEKKSMLQQNYEHLYNQITDLERITEETRPEVLAVQRKPEVLKEACMHANEHHMEPDLLHIQKNKVEEQMKIISDGCSENQIPMNSIEEKLTSKIFNQETMPEDLSSSFHVLHMACKQFRDQYQELHAKFHCAENVDKEQKEKGNLLESCNEFLGEFAESESGKAEADKVIAKLHRQVQTLHLQLRLSNQKLKTAKSEKREKEERQKKMVEVLQEKCTELVKQKYTSDEKLDFLENELTRVKIAAHSGISALDTRFHELETLFEQKHSQILSRIVICTEEIKTLKSEPEKERLMGEKHELTVRSKDKDEIIVMLRDEAVSLGAKLAEKEKDLEKLMRNMDKSEKKIEDLERRLKDKEDEAEARNDEKREAIRQLCLSIEYHREKYDHLSQYLPQSTRGLDAHCKILVFPISG